jgi:hypothetical protein
VLGHANFFWNRINRQNDLYNVKLAFNHRQPFGSVAFPLSHLPKQASFGAGHTSNLHFLQNGFWHTTKLHNYRAVSSLTRQFESKRNGFGKIFRVCRSLLKIKILSQYATTALLMRRCKGT